MPIDQAVSDFVTGAERLSEFFGGLEKIVGGFEEFTKLVNDLGPGEDKDFALSSNLSDALSSAKDVAKDAADAKKD